MKKISKQEKKAVIQIPENDLQMFEFFKRYLRFLRNIKRNNIKLSVKFEKRLLRYEKCISNLLERRYFGEDSPILNTILKWGLSRGEFKTFMYLLCGYEEDDRFISSAEDEEDFDLDEYEKIKAEEIINTFINDTEEIKNSLFNEGSKLIKKEIIKVEADKGYISSMNINATVKFSEPLIKYLSLIRYHNMDKNIKIIRHGKIKEPLTENLYTFLDKYIHPDTSIPLSDVMSLINKIDNLIKDGKVDIRYPVLLFYGRPQREIELTIKAIARSLNKDIIEYCGKSFCETFEELIDFEESDINPHIANFIRMSCYGEFISHLRVRSESELRMVNNILSNSPDTRKNLLIISSEKRLNSDILGLDKIKNSYFCMEFRRPDKEIRKRLWIETIPQKYYNGASYDDFAETFDSFSIEHIELTVRNAVENMLVDERSILEDRDIFESAKRVRDILNGNAKFNEADIFESDITDDAVVCTERLSDVILNPSSESEIFKLVRLIREKDKFYNDILMGRQTYGKGVKIMFYGLPGTGKTLTARAISGELGLPLLELHLNKLMNPLVGMTEKKIAEYFHLAKKENAILFIDECDSLIMNRENLNHSWEFSHINVLLKEIENFDGILIMSTNFESIRDKAINRRIHFFIRFDTPDFETRIRLFNYFVPEKYKIHFNINLICREEFTGGDLRNVWLRVAQRLFCGENINTEIFIEEIKKEREKSCNENNSKKCGF
ncbi:MAG: AAA family ATPase [Deltaproteobacteria bacterium]|nr:AAA family ATPase [Deltaproteobacteria bacterium]